MIGEFEGRRAGLYVEDEMTYEYVDSLIGPFRKLIGMKIVGGARSVLGCVEDDFRNGIRHTYGVIDRDYARDSSCGWNFAHGRCYCLPCHEIENYLLDWNALETFKDTDVGNVKTADQWRGVAFAVASKYLYSVAYNQVLFNVRKRLLEAYPCQKKMRTSPAGGGGFKFDSDAIESKDAVVEAIQQTDWFQDLSRRLGEIASTDWMRNRVSEVVKQYQDEMNSSADIWVRTFPGKEMFRAIVSSMFADRTRQVELARHVGKWQRKAGAVPDDFKKLFAHLSEVSIAF